MPFNISPSADSLLLNDSHAYKDKHLNSNLHNLHTNPNLKRLDTQDSDSSASPWTDKSAGRVYRSNRRWFGIMPKLIGRPGRLRSSREFHWAIIGLLFLVAVYFYTEAKVCREQRLACCSRDFKGEMSEKKGEIVPPKKENVPQKEENDQKKEPVENSPPKKPQGGALGKGEKKVHSNLSKLPNTTTTTTTTPGPVTIGYEEIAKASDNYSALPRVGIEFLLENTSLCQGQDEGEVSVVILVHSAAQHFWWRKAIRETWMTESKGRARILFVVGQPALFAPDEPFNITLADAEYLRRDDVDLHQQQVHETFVKDRNVGEELEKDHPKDGPVPVNVQEETTIRLKIEAKKYGDILQLNTMEAYQNMTYKVIGGLEWVQKYCSKVPYLLKVDDDVIVNMKRLLRIVDPPTITEVGNVLPEVAEQSRFLMCHYWYEQPMIFRRNPDTTDDDSYCLKWCVPNTDFYQRKYWPKFCSGMFWLTSMGFAGELAEKTRTVPLYWIDDMYITGLVPTVMSDYRIIAVNQNVTRTDYSTVLRFNSGVNLLSVMIENYKNFYYVWRGINGRG